MNIKAEVSEEDIDVIVAKLSSLAYAGASRASSKAIREGLRVIRNAIKAATPVGSAGRKKNGVSIVPGSLRRAVGSRFLKNGTRRERGVMVAKAGLNVGKKRKPKGGAARPADAYAPHAHMVALGTMPRWRGIKYGRGPKGANGLKPYNPEADDFSEKFKRKPGSKVKYLGAMKPNPFARWAAQRVEASATQAVRNKFKEAFDQEVRREAAKR